MTDGVPVQQSAPPTSELGTGGVTGPPGGRPEVGSEWVGKPADVQEPVIERKVDDTFSRIIDEGRQRLERDPLAMAATATMAGLEVGLGVLVMLVVDHRTHNDMLGAVAFSVGFLALLLGHSELFTEGFLVPVTTWVAGKARLVDLARFWAVTLVANLAGGWVMTWLALRGFPHIAGTAVRVGAHFIDAGIGVHSMVLGGLAGAAMTLMTRMQQGTESEPARVVAAVTGAFVLAGMPLFHSILDSLVIFTALHTGHSPYGYLDWLGWLSWTALWNVVGGVGLITLLRLVRSRKRVVHERQQVAEGA